MSSPSFYSAAGNFIDAVQGGVDPRTGLFNVSLPLMNLRSAGLSGPQLTLGLRYSPLSQRDEGFGRGFLLNMTRYDESSRSLILSTGEHYMLTESGKSLRQQRFKNFLFEKTKNKEYRVVYKSGLIETLQLRGSVYVTKSVLDSCARGFRYIYTWRNDNHTPVRLRRVTDHNGVELCSITYADLKTETAQVFVLQNDTAFSDKFIFTFTDDSLLTDVTRQNGEHKDRWLFSYDWAGPGAKYNIINSVKYPSGASESVSYYKERSMRFPDNAGPGMAGLPCVELHVISPGAGQPATRTRWTWTEENYLGRNAVTDKNIEWLSYIDPLLNLLLSTYFYGSTATILSSDSAATLASITRHYNSFHLQVSETRLRDRKTHTVFTEFYARPDILFENQPEQYLFPSSQTESWSDISGNSPRKRTTSWTYDSAGNMLRQQSPDGTLTEFTYYPAGGEADACPADPHGFIRYLKKQTNTPPRIKGDEPQTVQVHIWKKLTDRDDIWSVVGHSVTETTGNMRIVVTRSYYDDQTGEHYGRERARTTILTPDVREAETYVSSETFTYEVTERGFVQTDTLITDDCLMVTRSSRRHPFLGLLLSETDALGVTNTFEYDGASRLIRRTQAAGSAYETSAAWSYEMAEDAPVITATDETGNTTRISCDGVDREIKRERSDPKQKDTWHTVSVYVYNEFGELTSQTYDDVAPELQKTFSAEITDSYNGWGQPYKRTYSPDVSIWQESDPVTLNNSLYAEGITPGKHVSSGTLLTELDDRSLLPKTQFRKPDSGVREKTCEYEWDGLGRLREQTNYADDKIKASYTYDVFGRVLTRTLPDGSVISLTYASHLTGNQIASICVTGKDDVGNLRTCLLGTQTFDGLGRLTKRVSGGRMTEFFYEGVLTVASEIKLHSGTVLKYSYISEMGCVVTSLNTEGITQRFTYDPPTVQMTAAEEGSIAVHNELGLSGQLMKETFTQGNINDITSYTSTLAGAMITYMDVSDKKTTYTRDAFGRITEATDDDGMRLNQSYDVLNRLSEWTLTDTVAARWLKLTLEYNEFGQETTRNFTDWAGNTGKVTQTWTTGGLLRDRIVLIKDKEVSRETFDYDVRTRLTKYTAGGSNLPADAYGNRMTSQTYRYDFLNNLTQVITTLADGNRDIARYFYDNQNDPTQMTSLTHTFRGYPAHAQLAYDMDGRMITDEAGRTREYDALGRLVSISGNNIAGSRYGYDALNRLVSQNVSDADTRRLYYRGSELVTETLVERGHDLRLIKAGHTCMGVYDHGLVTFIMGDLNDSPLWSHIAIEERGHLHAWAPYGSGHPADRMPGFNGERVDPVSEEYHLGNGYRAYSPVLMRFRCPDDLSPFGAGGINAYAYCAGDPVNHTDPTGHISGWGIAAIVLGTLGLVVSGGFAGMAIAAAGGIGAAISAASTTALVVGGLCAVADVASIASGALEDVAPQASSALGWVALGAGFGGLGYGASRGISGALKSGRFITKGVRGHSSGALPLLTEGRGAMPRGAMHLGDDFYLFRAGERSDRLIITAHGEQAMFPRRTFLPEGTRMRFYSADRFALRADLNEIAAESVVARESLSGGGFIRNYNLSKFGPDNYAVVRSVVRRYGADVLTVRNRAQSILYPSDLNSLFRNLQSSNISYSTIDAVHCRVNWIGWPATTQFAL